MFEDIEPYYYRMSADHHRTLAPKAASRARRERHLRLAEAYENKLRNLILLEHTVRQAQAFAK
jgi:hypothetical protein